MPQQMATTAQHGFCVASSILTTIHKKKKKKRKEKEKEKVKFAMANLIKHSLGPHKFEPRVGNTSTRILGLDRYIPLFRRGGECCNN